MKAIFVVLLMCSTLIGIPVSIIFVIVSSAESSMFIIGSILTVVCVRIVVVLHFNYFVEKKKYILVENKFSYWNVTIFSSNVGVQDILDGYNFSLKEDKILSKLEQKRSVILKPGVYLKRVGVNQLKEDLLDLGIVLKEFKLE